MRTISNKTKVVIAGSASLQDKITEWKNFWNNKNDCVVIDFPSAIKKRNAEVFAARFRMDSNFKK